MVVAFLHSYDIFGVVFIFAVGGVTIWDGITKVVKKIKSGILGVVVGEHVHAVDNMRQEGEIV